MEADGAQGVMINCSNEMQTKRGRSDGDLQLGELEVLEELP